MTAARCQGSRFRGDKYEVVVEGCHRCTTEHHEALQRLSLRVSGGARFYLLMQRYDFALHYSTDIPVCDPLCLGTALEAG